MQHARLKMFLLACVLPICEYLFQHTAASAEAHGGCTHRITSTNHSQLSALPIKLRRYRNHSGSTCLKQHRQKKIPDFHKTVRAVHHKAPFDRGKQTERRTYVQDEDKKLLTHGWRHEEDIARQIRIISNVVSRHTFRIPAHTRWPPRPHYYGQAPNRTT